MEKEEEKNEDEVHEGEENSDINSKEFTWEKIFDDLDIYKNKREIYNDYKEFYNYGILTGDGTHIDSINIYNTEGNRKKYVKKNILKEEKLFIEWITLNNESYAMAVILSVAVFNCFSYMWILEAAEILYSSFEKAGRIEESRPAISDILQQFDAEICSGEINTYTGKEKVNVIRLSKEEHQEQILKCIWRECPRIHEKITKWLKSYNMKKPVIRAKTALNMLGNIASWDYYYFSHNMISMIQLDKDISTDIMIAQVIIKINSMEENAAKIENLMFKWSNAKNVHYRLTNLLICVELKDKKSILKNTIDYYIDEAVQGIQQHKENEYLRNLYDFFASGVRAFTFYRILIKKLFGLIDAEISTIEKRNICELFLRMFAIDIDLTRFEKESPIFITLCVKNSEVKKEICYLWKFAWRCRYYRKVFYNLLAQYDMKNKLDVYDLERFVKCALGDICTREIQEDICTKVKRGGKHE